MHPSHPRKPVYRPEIDGLRAIAVIAVIINHFNPAALPSGFLGVDIFFVISGFVVTSSLAHRTASSWKEYLSNFYARRIKRLVPALVCCVAVTSLLGCLFIHNPAVSLRTGMAALVGLSNISLLRASTDYFGQAAELNLFTQTWSLGVEEQFYIVFPILLGLCGFSKRHRPQGGKNLFCVMLLLTTLSLVGYLHLTHTHTSQAFFLMPARFWEVGAGCLTFLITQHFSRRQSPTPQSSYHAQQHTPQRVKGLLALLSLVLLVGVMFLERDRQVLATVATALLTCGLIGTVNLKSAVGQTLASKWMVQIGLLSYSLYLWHWSVLVLSRWTVGVSRWTIPWQLLLMIILALASQRLIETPLRHAQWSISQFKTIGYGLVASFLCIGLLGELKGGRAEAIYAGDAIAAAEIAAFQPHIPNTSVSRQNCHFHGKHGPVKAFGDIFSRCAVDGNPTSPKIYLYGDSHADALKGLLGRLYRKNNLSVETFSLSASPFPFLNYKGSHGYEPSVAQLASSDLEKRLLAQVSPGDLVFLSSYLYYYFTEPEDKVTTKHQLATLRYYSDAADESIQTAEVNQREALDIWSRKVASLASSLAEKDVAVILFAPLPQFEWDAYPGLAICQPEWFRPNPPASCAGGEEDKQELLQQRAPIMAVLNRTATKQPNLYIYDGFEVLCPDSEACSTHINGEAMYRDYSHLSNAGAEYLYDDLVQFLTPISGL